jgi:hypothetical protein
MAEQPLHIGGNLQRNGEDASSMTAAPSRVLRIAGLSQEGSGVLGGWHQGRRALEMLFDGAKKKYKPLMNIVRTTFPAFGLRSLAWDGDALVDWVAGGRYSLGGAYEGVNLGSSYRFDAAVGLGSWGVSFEAAGTKGRLLKDNGQRQSGAYHPMSVDVVREINRSYYHADDYLYPVTLFELPTGQTVLAHCPRGYNILDIEDLDGTCLTPRPIDGAADIFHSRLEASLDGRWLLSNGWVWHPWKIASVYDVARALAEPAYLSTWGEPLDLDFGENCDWEVYGATFADDRIICALTNEDKHQSRLEIHDLIERRREASIELTELPGTRLMALDNDHIMLVDGHPRVMRLSTGTIVERWDDLDGGEGIQQPGGAFKSPQPPWLAADPGHRRCALGWPDRIVIISLSP